jgi:serine protease Do
MFSSLVIPWEKHPLPSPKPKEFLPLFFLFAIAGVFLCQGQKARSSSDLFVELAAKIEPSVVTISSRGRGGGPWGVGTGFIVDSSGIVATNFHVIGDHREFSLELADGRICSPLQILAVDRSRDLALIKIEAEGLIPIPLGDSDKIKVGESVISMGNPLGYGLSVSRGVISAVRELEFGDGRPMIQVAIPIESGSSGSPVVNQSGEVLAILTIKSGGAMGFGVPVNALRSLLGEDNPIPIDQWLTVGMLDASEWLQPLGGNWRQRAGIIKASAMGEGFGGRMLCLSRETELPIPFDLEVEVRLQDESGAAGLAFCADGEEKHYGFYPTNGSLRLTSFNGPNVFNWDILATSPSPHYLPGAWNKLTVHFRQGGQIKCLVNDHPVFERVDFSFRKGWAGFCKFREPGAEFRNFRIHPTLLPGFISSQTRSTAYGVSESLVLDEHLSSEDLNQLVELGPAAHQALIDRADELETTSSRVRASAEKVRVALIINEIADLLTANPTEKGSNLVRCALLVSCLDNPNFQPDYYLRRVDRLSSRISQKFPPDAMKSEKLHILIDELFDHLGYHGSTLDYHHRSNSYLNEVIDDREGLPITLSLLFMEIGRRLELPISGLATPGHFLTLFQETGQPLEDAIIIDAFAGKIISRDQAEEVTAHPLTDQDFSPASDSQIISRILHNLLRSAQNEGDTSAVFRYLDALLAISPDNEYNRTLRAMTYYGEGRFEEALEDVTQLLDGARKEADNAPLLEIERRLLQIQDEK